MQCSIHHHTLKDNLGYKFLRSNSSSSISGGDGRNSSSNGLHTRITNQE